MNPIHESGFASLFVLCFGTFPAALSACIALLLVWKYPKGAATAANVALVLGALVCLFAAVTTVKLHSRVDYWIDTGGYGPPADIRAKYGADWHASARITAWVGLLFTVVPFLLSAIAYTLARRKNAEIEWPAVPLVLVGLGVFSCLVMGIL